MYRVILSEVCNEAGSYAPGDILETFLTYEEAFDFVGWCMVNDIEEFGRADVYQILRIDYAGHVIEAVELDNDLLEPPCRKPTYSTYGCLGCTKCKEDHEEDETALSVQETRSQEQTAEQNNTDAESMEFILTDEDVPF